MRIVCVVTPIMPGALLATVSGRPPAGAGSESVIGSEAVPANGTESEAGAEMMLATISTLVVVVAPIASVTDALSVCRPLGRLAENVAPVPSGARTLLERQ